MLIKDYYDTLSTSVEGLYKEKGSKFLAYGYPIINVDDVETRLTELKSIHPKSRHVCYAYRIGLEGEEFRINDDGEPSGTAGRPIFNEILSKDLTYVLIAVVRYFGGTKLGVSGLISAYKTATREALMSASSRRMYISDFVQLYYPIDKMGIMYKILKDQDIEEIQNFYGEKPYLAFYLRKSVSKLTIKKIFASYHGYQIEDIDDDFISVDLTFKIVEE
jgi:putative IMPACT (imprinted ancient) family translation regulator